MHQIEHGLLIPTHIDARDRAGRVAIGAGTETDDAGGGHEGEMWRGNVNLLRTSPHADVPTGARTFVRSNVRTFMRSHVRRMPILFPRRTPPASLITFILAEAEVERVPPELARHPKLLVRSKKRRRPVDQLLLDQAVDHDAMRALADGDRRGRPDIAHFWLLLVMDSLVAKRKAARVLVHTRHDELIRVRPDARLPRSQPKTYQLFEDLLRQGEVPLGAPLLSLERGRSLVSVVREESKGARVLMDVGGERARAGRFEALARAGDVTIVTGGFPRGAYRQAKPEWFDHVLRVADEELTVWSAMVPVLAGFEDANL